MRRMTSNVYEQSSRHHSLTGTHAPLVNQHAE